MLLRVMGRPNSAHFDGTLVPVEEPSTASLPEAIHVLGAPLLGRFEGRRAGHALNNRLCRALMASPEAWRYVPAQGDLARAV